MSNEFSFIGVDSLISKMDSIVEETRYKTGRSALRKAAKVMADAAKDRANRLDDPDTGRSIADNVRIAWNGKEFKRSGNLYFKVGIRGGAKLKDAKSDKSSGPTPHWRLLEFGTSRMRAQPIMRPSFTENVSRSTTVFLTEFEKAIDRAIRKAKR